MASHDPVTKKSPITKARRHQQVFFVASHELDLAATFPSQPCCRIQIQAQGMAALLKTQGNQQAHSQNTTL